jgi:hypothetical protein
MGYRADQYAAAWTTLSPATRRRLEQYVNRPSTSAQLDYRSRQRRAVMRKRSYSADHAFDEYYEDAGNAASAVPHIREWAIWAACM